jgi:hypothetical protein
LIGAQSHNGTRKGETMPKTAARSRNGLRAVRTEMKTRADQVTRSLAQIQGTLRRTERKIEKDARERIRQLRKEAKKQATVVRGHQREAQRILQRLSIAGEESWGDMKRAAYRAIADARTVADSLRDRFRRAVGES